MRQLHLITQGVLIGSVYFLCDWPAVQALVWNGTLNRRIHADVIVYIFAHLHAALRIEGNMLDMN